MIPTTISTTSLCDRFELMHDFLDSVGSEKFLVAFENDEHMFSRRPGQVTTALKRRKTQFTRWIENIFSRIKMHFQKKRFLNCFQDKIDPSDFISQSFDQCYLLNSRFGFEPVLGSLAILKDLELFSIRYS